jgi:predicted GNAT superfamily acetyltransferase
VPVKKSPNFLWVSDHPSGRQLFVALSIVDRSSRGRCCDRTLQAGQAGQAGEAGLRLNSGSADLLHSGSNTHAADVDGDR